MPPTFHRDRYTWLLYSFLALYGYFINILGPITPFLKQELGLSYTVASLHFTAFAAGILAVGMAGHAVIRRAGRWTAFWIGAFGCSGGALALLAGRSPVVTIGAAFGMGLIGSLILVLVPAALSDHHGEGRAVALSEANVISSFAGAVSPLLVGWFASLPGGWRLALGLAAAVPVFMRLGPGRSAPVQPASRQEAPEAVQRRLPLAYWVYWAALFLGVAVEFCMLSWSADYLEQSLGLPKVEAVQALTLFLAAMIMGRLAVSRLVQRSAPQRVVIASVLLAGVGFSLFWMTHLVATALAGLFVTGLGVAGIYPLLLSLAIGAARDNAVQASARATLASGAAIVALPLILGRLADQVGIQPAYGVVALLLAGVLAIVLATTLNQPRPSPR